MNAVALLLPLEMPVQGILVRAGSALGGARVKTLLTMLRFNRLVNRFGGPTDASELILV